MFGELCIANVDVPHWKSTPGNHQKMADEKLSILLDRLNSLAPYNPQWKIKNNQSSDHLDKTNGSTLHGNDPHNTNNIRVKNETDEISSYEPSVTIVLTPNSGRQLVTARDVKAGEVLLCEPGLLPLLPKQGGGPTCLGCLRTLPDEDYPVCEGCGAPSCSPKCNGGLHTQQECIVIAKRYMKNEEDPRVRMLRIKEINTVITPLRTKLALDQNPDLMKLINCLELNFDKRNQIPKSFEMEKKMFSWSRVEAGFAADEQVAEVLRNHLDVDVEEETVLKLCSLYDTNAFDVPVSEEYSGRSRALFPVIAMMNHDCVPNTQHWYIDGLMNVRAATDIPRGSAVTLNYTEVLWGTRARKAFLAYSKLFICSCPRCSDPTELGTHMSSLTCKRCHVGRLVPSYKPGEPHKCSDCSFTISTLTADTVVKACGMAFTKTDKNSVEDLNKTYKKLEHGLGPQHFICVELKHRLVQAIMKTNLQELSSSDLWRVIDFTDDLLDLADTLVPGKSFFRGHMLLERVRAATELITRYHMSDKESVEPLLNGEKDTFIYFPEPETSIKNSENVKDCKDDMANYINEKCRKFDLKMLLMQAKEGQDTMQYAKRVPIEAFLVVIFLENLLNKPQNHKQLNKEAMDSIANDVGMANGVTNSI